MWGTIRYYMLNVAVAPREGRVSRNFKNQAYHRSFFVAPREGRVSRNYANRVAICLVCSRAPRGACE